MIPRSNMGVAARTRRETKRIGFYGPIDALAEFYVQWRNWQSKFKEQER